MPTSVNVDLHNAIKIFIIIVYQEALYVLGPCMFMCLCVCVCVCVCVQYSKPASTAKHVIGALHSFPDLKPSVKEYGERGTYTLLTQSILYQELLFLHKYMYALKDIFEEELHQFDVCLVTFFQKSKREMVLVYKRDTELCCTGS